MMELKTLVRCPYCDKFHTIQKQDKRIAELEAFIEQQSKRIVKLIKEGSADD